MTTFTIDQENAITAFATAEEAAAATATPFDSFTSEKELAELIAEWPAERLLATYNSLPGVTPAKGFKTAQAAASKIWKRIEKMGQPEEPKAEHGEQPKREKKAKGRTQSAQKAPAKGKATKKAIAAKNAPKAKTAAKGAKPTKAAKSEASAPREGSKTATIVALLERKGGATLSEIMKAAKWQAHSCRGFISGTLGKKMGRTVESTKRDDGERVYKLTD